MTHIYRKTTKGGNELIVELNAHVISKSIICSVERPWIEFTAKSVRKIARGLKNKKRNSFKKVA